MLSMYDISIPPLVRTLNNLSAVLTKAEKHADAKKIEQGVFISSRLFPDMYPLSRQVQIATDMSKGAAARLAGVDMPKYEDNEATFAELQARIAKTVAFLETIQPRQLKGAETRDISLTVGGRTLEFTGEQYLLSWVNPNVYFHVTTAYNILRHNGVELSKRDYLGGN